MEKPGPAYLGDDDYVFVSYSHSNADTVYVELTRLQREGMKIWYDEGISPGSRWTQEIADAIERCKVFVAFVSIDFISSENCVNEAEFAVSKGKRIIAGFVRRCAAENPGTKSPEKENQRPHWHCRCRVAGERDLCNQPGPGEYDRFSG